MILLWFIIILMAGGILAWIAAQWSVTFCRWISFIALAINLVLGLMMWFEPATSNSPWLTTFTAEWIPSFGIGRIESFAAEPYLSSWNTWRHYIMGGN